jgi:hypothetical protein
MIVQMEHPIMGPAPLLLGRDGRPPSSRSTVLSG